MVAVYRGPGVVGWDADAGLAKGVVSPTEHRLGISPLAQRQGVFQSGDDPAGVTTSTTSREISVKPASAAIDAPLGGFYLPSWSSAVSVTPAVAGSQDRIDTIVLSQHDYEVDAAATSSAAEITVVAGTPSATPQPAVLDEGQLALWYVRVHAGDVSSSQFGFTRAFAWTAPVAGVLRFSDAAERDAAIGSPYAGQQCLTGAGATLARWAYDGAAWHGQYVDTGWKAGGTALPWLTSYVAPQYRIVEGVVHWRAYHYRSSGSWDAGTADPCWTGIPAEALPESVSGVNLGRPLDVATSNGAPLHIIVWPTEAKATWHLGSGGATYAVVSGSYPARPL